MMPTPLKKKQGPPDSGNYGSIPPAEITPDPLPTGEIKPTGKVSADIPTAGGPPAKQVVADLVRQNPAAKVPSQGAESFNEYRGKVLPRVRAAMQQLAHNPTQYVPMVLPPQAVGLVNGWIAAGMPDDYAIDHEAMAGGATGVVELLVPVKESPGWRKEAVQIDQPLPPPPGILLISHGMDEDPRLGKDRGAMVQLAKHTKSAANMDARNFGRVRAFAHQATQEGMSDEDIDGAIDSALPSPEEAADMPNSRLLAIATAASPAKRAQYAPLIQDRFKDLSGLPPEGQAALSKHLKTHFGV